MQDGRVANLEKLPLAPDVDSDASQVGAGDKIHGHPNRISPDGQTPSAPSAEEEYPEGGYGWVVAVCILGVNAGTWGVNTTYGVYNSFYVENNYFAGGTPLRYAFVGGLSSGVAFAVAPLANFLAKRFHFRVPMIVGTVAMVLGQALAALSHEFGAFLALQGVVFGLGLGLTMVPCQPLIAHWFNKRLSVAQGFAQAGSGMGALILSNTTRVAIQSIGIKWSLVINGLVSLILLIPAILFARGRKSLGARMDPLQAHFLWHPGYFFVLLWGCLSVMGYFIAIYSLATYSTNGLGLSQTQGAALQSILAAGQVVGRPAAGWLLDAIGRCNGTIIVFILAGVSCFAIWLPSRTFGVLVVFALAQGVLGGTIWSATPVVSKSVVGIQHLGSALAIFWLAIALPSALCFPAAVALVDYSRSSLGRQGPDAYTISICLCGALFFASAIALYGGKVYVQGNWRIMQKA